MSVVAKILVVLNLVLAVVFLGAAGTFLGQKESWKIKHADLKKATDITIATKDENISQLSDELSAQTAAAVRANGQAENFKQQMEGKEAEYKAIVDRHNQLIAQYERLSQTYQDVVNTIGEYKKDKATLISEKDAASAKARQATDDMNNAVKEAARLTGIIADRDDAIAALEKKAFGMGEQIEKLDMVLLAYKDKFGDIGDVMAPKKISAVVSAANGDMNIVILSVGRDDGVKEGYEFTVYRGNDYVGKVIIDTVEKDYCSGYSKKELEKSGIKVGDKATTRF